MIEMPVMIPVQRVEGAARWRDRLQVIDFRCADVYPKQKTVPPLAVATAEEATQGQGRWTEPADEQYRMQRHLAAQSIRLASDRPAPDSFPAKRSLSQCSLSRSPRRMDAPSGAPQGRNAPFVKDNDFGVPVRNAP